MVKLFWNYFFFFCIVIWVLSFSLTYLSVPLFRLYCQNWGPDGFYGFLNVNFLQYLTEHFFIIYRIHLWYLQFQQFSAFFLFKDPPLIVDYCSSDNFNVSSKLVYVHFRTKVHDNLPLLFESVSPFWLLRGGRAAIFTLNVTNVSEKDVYVSSIYNLWPPQAYRYFEKIECFCYDHQLIPAQSRVDLPIMFSINNKDVTIFDHALIREVTVTYAIFSALGSASERWFLGPT